MKFCSECGAAVRHDVPPDDDRHRAICTRCGTVHYENPKMVVGCVVEAAGGLLLCRRAIEPGRGRWTLPAGFLELDESAIAGAVRETREEANADVDVLAPHAYLDLPHIGQTYALFRARLRGEAFSPGAESLEVRVFDESELPWEHLAFPVVHFALELLLDDRRRGHDHVHVASLEWRGTGSRFSAHEYRLAGHIALPVRPRAD